MNKGQLIVLSGPSGVGKGTVLKKVLASDANLTLSVSATTRQMRPGENDGVNYHFISEDKFSDLIAQGNMLEYAEVYDNYYGTLKDVTVDLLNQGKDVILEIDTVGAMNIKNMFPSAVTIFLVPPNKEELIERLRGRGTETEEVFNKRIAAATAELDRAAEYDYIVLNDNADVCAQEVINIISKIK